MFEDNNFIETHKDLDILNLRTEIEYFFRRVYFLIDDKHYVEYVALASESSEFVGGNIIKGCEVAATSSRELELSKLSPGMFNSLMKQEEIVEVFKISYDQFHALCHNYKTNLFSINNEVINNMN